MIDNVYKFSKNSKLSNYYECPVIFDGFRFGSSEAAYQAHKTMDRDVMAQFVNLNPDEAKRLGRSLQVIRPDFEMVKMTIMYNVCMAKFSQNPECLQVLKRTGNRILIEDTTGWCDNVWGVCHCKRCAGVNGKNLLGQVLMSVRSSL